MKKNIEFKIFLLENNFQKIFRKLESTFFSFFEFSNNIFSSQHFGRLQAVSRTISGRSVGTRPDGLTVPVFTLSDICTGIMILVIPVCYNGSLTMVSRTTLHPILNVVLIIDQLKNSWTFKSETPVPTKLSLHYFCSHGIIHFTIIDQKC